MDQANPYPPAPIHGKRIFITGGAGFIGSALLGRLVQQNDIVVYDDFRRDALTGTPQADHPRLTIIRGDVLDAQRLCEAIQDAQIVVHCAAVAGIDTVIQRPTDTMRVNLLGTANVLEAARQLPALQRLVLGLVKVSLPRRSGRRRLVSAEDSRNASDLEKQRSD